MDVRKTDRRQNNVDVTVDRRSGIDRRDVKQNDSVFEALEVIPTFRRTASVEDKLKNGDYVPALGAVGLTVLYAKEDWKDLKSAAQQIYSKINPNYHYDPLYDRRNLQHAFSTTRGMVGEDFLHEQMAEGSKIAQTIYRLDKSLDETKFGKAVNNFFQTKKTDFQLIETIKDKSGNCAKAVKYESKILGGEITGRAMRRTTVLGILLLCALEFSKIIKVTAKGDNFIEHTENGAKQTAESGINIFATAASIAYGGAIGSKYAGATGSLIGMGLGAIAGNRVSDKLQKAIF